MLTPSSHTINDHLQSQANHPGFFIFFNLASSKHRIELLLANSLLTAAQTCEGGNELLETVLADLGTEFQF